MNWLLDIFNSVKWKIEDAVWAVQDRIILWKEMKSIDKKWDEIEEVEEIEAKPKKKKAKKKSAKKSKKSV